MKPMRTFFGKILLFGEYAVIEGSSVAVIPYKRVQAKLSLAGSLVSDNHAFQSNRILRSFAVYLHSLIKLGISGIIDIRSLTADLESGLYLQSTIPESYGLGSSGALCAAVYDAYRLPGDDVTDLPLKDLQMIFSNMESYFHGSSSGIDPLSIFLGKPLGIRQGNYVQPVNNRAPVKKSIRVFLIDTGMRSQTKPLVKYFSEQMKQPEFYKHFTGSYLPLVNQLVDQWLSGQLEIDLVSELSILQLQFMLPMIPENCREMWQKGTDTGLYTCKLCGSGGGGMLLGFTQDITATKEYLWKNYRLAIQPLEGV